MGRHNGNTQPAGASRRRRGARSIYSPPLSVEGIEADLRRSKPKPSLVPSIACASGKTGYPTEQAALDALAAVQARHAAGDNRRAMPTRVYGDCSYNCGGWHMTAQPAKPGMYRSDSIIL
jgi:hypothetical protein